MDCRGMRALKSIFGVFFSGFNRGTFWEAPAWRLARIQYGFVFVLLHFRLHGLRWLRGCVCKTCKDNNVPQQPKICWKEA